MTANDSATYEWTVSGMDCASCAGKVHLGGCPGNRLELPQQGTITFMQLLLET